MNRAGEERRAVVGMVLGLACVWMVFFWASPAWGWTFQRNGQACFEPDRTEIEHETPAMMMMLDRSGSMGERSEYCCRGQSHNCGYFCGPSLWQLAVQAVKEVVRGLTRDGGGDEVLFGLGFFPPVRIEVEADPARVDSYDVIGGFLDQSYPNGFTPTAEAIAAVRQSSTLQMQGRPVAGVLITDGEPSGGIAPREEAIEEACKLRSEGKILYVVGFSTMTDEAFNNMMAAAGGTGCCGPDASLGCPLGVGLDPCDRSRRVDARTCVGSVQADSGDAFKNALLQISQEVACTFPLDLAAFPGQQAPEDVRAIRVWADGAQIGEAIPYREGDQEEGWYFPNVERDRIALSSAYCERIQAKQITTVTTQLACVCEQATGDVCGPDHGAGDCMQGVWECEEGVDRCALAMSAQCEDVCVGWIPGSRCHVDTFPVQPAGDQDWVGEKNRCKIGEVVCTAQGPVCRQVFEPMPELCNGLDDDCDGKIDNIVESWKKAEFLEVDSSSGHAGATCLMRDACVCPAGSGQHVGSSGAGEEPAVTWAEEVSAYLAGWEPVCHCAAALNP